MKNKLPLIVAITSAIGLPFANAQEDRPPQPPAQPVEPRPPSPPEGPRSGPRERRPEAERGPGAPAPERGSGRSDGEHGPGRFEGGHHSDGDRPFSPRGDNTGRGGTGSEWGAPRP